MQNLIQNFCIVIFDYHFQRLQLFLIVAQIVSLNLSLVRL